MQNYWAIIENRVKIYCLETTVNNKFICITTLFTCKIVEHCYRKDKKRKYDRHWIISLFWFSSSLKKNRFPSLFALCKTRTSFLPSIQKFLRNAGVIFFVGPFKLKGFAYISAYHSLSVPVTQESRNYHSWSFKNVTLTCRTWFPDERLIVLQCQLPTIWEKKSYLYFLGLLTS